MILIKNALLQSMAEGEDEQRVCDILIENKKIAKIGEIKEGDFPNAKVIDAKSKLVTPGFIESHCHIGLSQDEGLEMGNDTNELTDPIVPNLKGIDGVKFHDASFRTALEAGITTVATGPGSGEIIAGTFCILKTHGKTVYDMCVVEESFMKMALGENPKRVFGSKGKMPMTRMAIAAMLRENLTKAKSYYDKKQKYEKDLADGKEDAKEVPYDSKLEGLSKVFAGLPVKIHAHQQNDIVTALKIMEEFNLDGTIEHCTEGYIIPELLKEKGKGVIIGPTFIGKSKLEVFKKTFDSGRILEENGIEFAIMTDHPVIPIEQMRTQAAIFIKHGLSYMAALKALTINAAKLCGVSDRVGSIEVGKDADIVIWSTDPFHYLAEAETVIVNGEVAKG